MLTTVILDVVVFVLSRQAQMAEEGISASACKISTRHADSCGHPGRHRMLSCIRDYIGQWLGFEQRLSFKQHVTACSR